jgi:protein phosphatase 1 regulatory subunit 16A
LAAILLSHGADINAHDIEMWTPLHAASRCGNLELVKLLIVKGADLVPINSDGQMPFEIADTSFVLLELQRAMEEQGYNDDNLEDIRNALPNQILKDVEECIKNNVDLNLGDKFGATILHIAAANGFYQVADLLLMHGAKVNLQDNDGWTPLHGASCWGQVYV